MIKVNLGLIKEVEEVPELESCPNCGGTAMTEGWNCKYCTSCGWKVRE
jgi:ribosomal protein S27AE